MAYWPPKGEDELPKAGVDDAPKAGVELPNAGEDDAPKLVVEENGDDVAPKTPVELPPKIELPVCAPNVGLPKGLGAKGLLFVLLVCPNADGVPNGLLLDCPKAVQVKK